ncbi:MAG: hypothetical protein ACAH83_01990 [Alphaproteobacteria bacterium]
MSKTITAVFDTRTEAEFALAQLDQAGYTRAQVTMLITEESRGKHFGVDDKTKVAEGAATGATIAGLSAGLFLALGSAGALLVPGLNLIVSGALVGGLAGLGAGAVGGGLVGALVGLGVPEHEAKLYEDTIRKGAILIAVDASDAAGAERVKSILKNTKAQSITALAA